MFYAKLIDQELEELVALENFLAIGEHGLKEVNAYLLLRKTGNYCGCRNVQ